MAENKKSVLLYCDIIHTVEELSDDEAGRLFKHYLRYINDQNPVAPDKLTKVLFEPIKQNLKRDLKKWEMIREKRSEAGQASAERRKQAPTSVEHIPTSVESVEQTPTNSTVTVTVKVKEINIPFSEFWDLYDKKVGNKAKCENKWNKLKDIERQKIVDSLPSFILGIKDKQYQPYPETYLNQCRWNDEVITSKEHPYSDAQVRQLKAHVSSGYGKPEWFDSSKYQYLWDKLSKDIWG